MLNKPRKQSTSDQQSSSLYGIISLAELDSLDVVPKLNKIINLGRSGYLLLRAKPLNELSFQNQGFLSIAKRDVSAVVEEAQIFCIDWQSEAVPRSIKGLPIKPKPSKAQCFTEDV